MSETDDKEPSTLALDVYWASGRGRDPRIERHVARCARCQAYLRDLDDLGERARRESLASLPEGGIEVADRAAEAGPARPRWRGIGVGAGALAATAVALLVARHAIAPPAPYVGAKGTPAVQLLVRHGSTTRVWDGRAPVRGGDSLALRVACEGEKRVAVAAKGDAGWKVLEQVGWPPAGRAAPVHADDRRRPGERGGRRRAPSRADGRGARAKRRRWRRAHRRALGRRFCLAEGD